MNIGIIGILAALILLMILVYKRINLVIVSLLCCALVAICNQLPVLDTITSPYMSGFADFVNNNFLLFVFSAIFGKLMEESGAASSFAKLIYRAFGSRWAIYGVMIATALLVYGGVSNFVIVFTVFPIFLFVCKEVNLPIRLIPGFIFSASATFAASMLPGTPSLNNIIPTQYLGTNAMAAPLIGIVTSIVTILLIFFYFEYEIKKARAANDSFQTNPKVDLLLSRLNEKDEVNPWLSIVPMASLVILLNVFKLDILYSLAIAMVLVILFFRKNISDSSFCISEGLGSATSAIINTSAAVGFGSAVKATEAFTSIVNSLMSIGGNPLISLGLITTIVSGITGSGTGGIAITLQVFADRFLELGLDTEVMHRVVAIASNGLDSLPHNGLVITVITACGCTHKTSYKPIMVTSVIITLIALAIALAMGIVLY